MMGRLRVGLGLAGLAVAAVAVATDNPRITWAGVALLTGSLIVRLLQRRDRDL
jgi:hypothetical protein